MASQGDDGGPPGPDFLSQALDAFALQSSAQDEGTVPLLPPGMAAMKGKSTEEILADLNKTPLFMTSMEENDDLEALKALAYEGTPTEVSQSFKEYGNECFKEKKWVDAKEFYSKGIAVLQAEQRKRTAPTTAPRFNDNVQPETGLTSEPTSEADIKSELTILEACLGNRAACHHHLKNYRSCTLDCASVLRLNPSNIKAYYRSGVALLALNKIPEADDACARGLALDPNHKDLLALAAQIITKNEAVQAKAAKELQAEQRKKLEIYLVRTALMARGIKSRKTAQPPEMEDAKVQLVPDPTDPKSELVFPTVLLYPLVLQSDFIKDFGETQTLGDRLAPVLEETPIWDFQREYTLKGTECYMETMTGGLIKVGRNVSLLKVLSGGKVEVVDEVVKIFVLPKKKAEAWIADFKRKKAAEKGIVE